ncbi:MAG: oxidoreductase [bacterium]|nr:oxidoreductase [bacterium]
MTRLFTPIQLRGVTARNRIMMSPMSQARADEQGVAQMWHAVHYGSRAVGGVGLLLMEDTAISEAGRLNQHSLGMYDDAHVAALRHIVEFCRGQGACVGAQLGHAGPKAWSKTEGQGPLRPVSPSGRLFAEGWVLPSVLTVEEIASVLDQWRAAARRAVAASYDFVEVHAGHGYLINAFLSPLTNARDDAYGRDRTRLLFESVAAVREVIPLEMPVFVRLSVEDLVPGGWTLADTQRLAGRLREAGVDALDLSWGGIGPTQGPLTLEERRNATRRVREAARLPVVAVGLVESAQGAEAILGEGTADIVAIGRLLLRNPYWALDAAEALAGDLPLAVTSPYGIGAR